MHNHQPSYFRNNIYGTAQILLSRILNEQLKSLSKLTNLEYENLCKELTPYLNDEYKIWQGNNALLESCMRVSRNATLDPARVILNRVIQIANNSQGYLVVT